VPQLTDFGLARRIDSPSGKSARTRIVGTLAFMAPEQTDETPAPAATTCDIYSLAWIPIPGIDLSFLSAWSAFRLVE
jgi:serine/threonine protein kinase